MEAQSVDYLTSLGINSNERSMMEKADGHDQASIQDIEAMLKLQLAQNGQLQENSML